MITAVKYTLALQMMPIWMENTGLGAMDVPSGTIPIVKSKEASTKSIGRLLKYPSAS